MRLCVFRDIKIGKGNLIVAYERVEQLFLQQGLMLTIKMTKIMSVSILTEPIMDSKEVRVVVLFPWAQESIKRALLCWCCSSRFIFCGPDEALMLLSNFPLMFSHGRSPIISSWMQITQRVCYVSASLSSSPHPIRYFSRHFHSDLLHIFPFS